MSIGLISVLKLVPWGDVISNAPKIAEGAMKLWRTVARKPQATELPPSAEQSPLSEAETLAMLQTRLTAAEAEISDLHSLMLESSDLIKALADQNTQLIKRLETNRIRILWLTRAVVALAVAAAINLAITFAR